MARGSNEKDTCPDPDDKKPQYGCELAPKIPPGVHMIDVRQQKWTIGS